MKREWSLIGSFSRLSYSGWSEPILIAGLTYIGRINKLYRLISCLSIGLWDGVAVGASVACGWCGRGTNAQLSSYIIMYARET